MNLAVYNWAFDGHPVPVYVRPDSAGDTGVLQQIFVAEDYKISQWPQGVRLREYFEQQVAAGRTPLIVDAGANIGASALYFSLHYPGALVYAIEPDKDNCALAKLNCRDRNISVFEGAIGCKDGEMFLHDPGEGDWGFRVLATGTTAVPVIAPTTFLAEPALRDCAPLICKIDIEGGEDYLFSEDTAWVNRFPLVVIELHDWMLPFSGSSRNFIRTIASYDFDMVYKGENIFCFNRALLG